MATIGKKTIEKTSKMLRRHLERKMVAIDTAYCSVDGPFKVDLAVTFKPDLEGIKIKTKISFYPIGKLEDEAEAVVDEKQMDLPFKDPDEDVVDAEVTPKQIGHTPMIENNESTETQEQEQM